jgi:hypothetical protein
MQISLFEGLSCGYPSKSKNNLDLSPVFQSSLENGGDSLCTRKQVAQNLGLFIPTAWRVAGGGRRTADGDWTTGVLCVIRSNSR